MKRLFCLAALLLGLGPAAARAQDCKMLFCAPTLDLAPGLLANNLFGGPRVRMLPGDEEVRLPSEKHLDLLVQLRIPSTLPRTSFFVEASWTPFAGDETNEITGYDVSELEDAAEITDNLPSLQLGVSLALLKREATGGWLGLDVSVGDQFSPAAEPDEANKYTHKLDLGLDGTIAIFNWLPKGGWLSSVTAFLELGHVASGLADSGDEIPKGERLYLEDASPWSLRTGLTLPIAPIAREP